MASSIDGIARAAKNSIRTSLTIAHDLTRNSSSPAGSLMHRMNEVLRSVVDTNFGPPSLESVGALYGAIGEATPLLTECSHDIALSHLARVFAVVIEEAVRSRGGAGSDNNNNNNNNNTNNNPTSGDGRSEEMCRKAGSFYGGPPVPLMSISTTPAAGAASAAGGQLQGYGLPAKPAATSGRANSAAAAAARARERAEKEKEKDYSAEAVMGRVTIFKIPFAVTELQVRAHFEQIGEVVEISYPSENGKHKGFALLKFADNAVADEVVAQLNGKSLGGVSLTVERAKYWFHRHHKSAPPSRFSSSSTFGGAKPRAESVDSDEEAVDDEDSTDDNGTDPGIC